MPSNLAQTAPTPADPRPAPGSASAALASGLLGARIVRLAQAAAAIHAGAMGDRPEAWRPERQA